MANIEYKRKIEFEERNRISNGTAILMLGLAILVDLSMALLSLLIIGFILNPILTPFVWLTYYVWYKIKDVGFFDKLLRFGIMFIIGAIEITPLGILPTWTIGTFLIIWSVRADDAIYNKTKGLADFNRVALAIKERDSRALLEEGRRVVALRQQQNEAKSNQEQLVREAEEARNTEKLEREALLEQERELLTENNNAPTSNRPANDNRPQFKNTVENQIANDNRPQYNRMNNDTVSEPKAA